MAGWAPPPNGMTWSETFESWDSSSRYSSCGRMSPAPPTRRRSAASSSTAHTLGGSALVSVGWRAIRSATWRSMSSWGLVTMPALITVRAYSSVCSRLGIRLTS